MIELLASVFVASITGSLHCAGMCGGLAAFYSAGARGNLGARTIIHTAYHLSRLVAYAAAGATAGMLGDILDTTALRLGIGQAAAAAAGAVILVWGGTLLVGNSRGLFARWRTPFGIDRALAALATRLRQRPPLARAATLGLCSALLPCGWLYAFIVVAGGTGTAASGLLVMSVFWLGTVPALVGLGMGVRAIARRLGHRAASVSAAALMAVGIVTVLARASGTVDTRSASEPERSGAQSSGSDVPAEPTCHGH